MRKMKKMKQQALLLKLGLKALKAQKKGKVKKLLLKPQSKRPDQVFLVR